MKLALWRQFLQNQEMTAGSVFVLAAVLVLWWALLVRGRRWERWISWGAVGVFWLLAGGALCVGW